MRRLRALHCSPTKRQLRHVFLRFGRVLMRHDLSQKWVIYGIHALGSCHYSGDEPEDLRYLVFRQTDVLLCGRWNSDMEGLCWAHFCALVELWILFLRPERRTPSAMGLLASIVTLHTTGVPLHLPKPSFHDHHTINGQTQKTCCTSMDSVLPHSSSIFPWFLQVPHARPWASWCTRRAPSVACWWTTPRAPVRRAKWSRRTPCRRLPGHKKLVGGLEHGFYDFPYFGNVIIPTDELIFLRGVGWNHQPEKDWVMWLVLNQSEMKMSKDNMKIPICPKNSGSDNHPVDP